MKKILFLTFLLLLFIRPVMGMDPIIAVSWDQEPLKIKQGESIKTRVDLRIPEGYFVYAEKTDLELTTLEGIRVTKVIYPQTSEKPDPLTGEAMIVFVGDCGIEVEMNAPTSIKNGEYDVEAILHYQGCSDKICLKPEDKPIKWTVLVGAVVPKPQMDETVVQNDLSGNWLDFFRGKASEKVLSIELKWLIVMAFIGGVLSGFTPCVLPLIPITLLIIGVKPRGNWRANFGLSFLLVLGMSITYAALGIIAASLGMSLGFLFQSKIFLILVIIFLCAMSLSLLGIYTMQLPTGMRNALSKLGGGGYRGAFFAGISMGLLATPCVGPVLGALLVYAGSSKSIGISFTLLMIYSIGLGLVIMLAGTWYGTVVGKFKAARMKWAKKVIGILLFLPALYYLNAIIPMTSIFGGGSLIKWVEQETTVASVSASSDRPKMILFTAEWCPPCKILENFVLKNSDVVEMSKKFIDIKVDTTESSQTNETLAETFGIKGWPTVVFVSPKGKFYDDLTISGGFITSKELLSSMKEALSR